MPVPRRVRVPLSTDVANGICPGKAGSVTDRRISTLPPGNAPLPQTLPERNVLRPVEGYKPVRAEMPDFAFRRRSSAPRLCA